MFFWREFPRSTAFIRSFLHKQYVCSCWDFMSNWELLEFLRLVSLSSVSLLSCCLHKVLLANLFLSSLTPPRSSSCEAILACLHYKGRSASRTFPNAWHFYHWGAPTEQTHHAKPWSAWFWPSHSPHLFSLRSVHLQAEVPRKRPFQDQRRAAYMFSFPRPSSLNCKEAQQRRWP